MLKKVIDWIENEATDVELIDVVNEVNSWNGYLESFASYSMDSLDDIFCDMKPTDLLNALASDFDIRKERFREGVYGVESLDTYEIVEDIKTYVEEVAEAIIDNMEHIDIPDSLQEILEEE